MTLTSRRARRTLHNAFRSKGFRRFGVRFALDYLRVAWHTARRWGVTADGTLKFLGFEIEYSNRSDALFLLHEVFVNATYEFPASSHEPIVIDCGANIGMATLFFKALHPSAKVTAIEPNPTAFEKLSRNVARNRLRDVTLLRTAVAEREGEVDLYSASPASLVATTTGPQAGEACPVPAIRLSSLISSPVDFLKLDVEGAEYGVVRDLVASGAIRHVRAMTVEYHERQAELLGLAGILEALNGAGMKVQHLGVDATSRSGIFLALAAG